MPLPTPVRDLTLDLWIEFHGLGFILYCNAIEDSSFSSDTWCDTLEHAVKAAEEWFGVKPEIWQEILPRQDAG